MNEVMGGIIGALVTGVLAVFVAWVNQRSKRMEVDADAKIRPQLAFYEDLMTRVTHLEGVLALLSRDRDELNRQLNETLARCKILEARIKVVDEALRDRDTQITTLRRQRDHYRRLAAMGSEELRLGGQKELGETLSAAIEQADDASSLGEQEK